jgi:hypothetical protein
MKNTLMLGNGLERVLLLLLVGMGSGLIAADSLDQLRPTVAKDIRAVHEPFRQISMPQSLLITCELPNDTATFPKPTCSLRIA